MKNVISFSLWGTQPMYWAGAVKNVNLAREYFPGWICRFYIDNQSPRSLVEPIIRSGAEVVFKDRVDEFGGLFWRFLAASDPEVDAVAFRDCDSRISAREYSAVEAWLGSHKRVHIIRDHPYHNTPILGGMFGCKSGVLSNMDDF